MTHYDEIEAQAEAIIAAADAAYLIDGDETALDAAYTVAAEMCRPMSDID